jgi:peptidylprolyl isomerase
MPSTTSTPAPAPADTGPTIPAPPDVGAPPADAVTTPSGVATKVLTPGTGKAHPGLSDNVKVNYTGWTKSGRMFDSSITRGQPVTLPMNAVIPGWAEGVSLMVVGEKRRMWIPAARAYGFNTRRPFPAGDLVFEIELLDFSPGP